MKVFLNRPLPEAGMALLADADVELTMPATQDLTRAEWLGYCQQADVVANVGWNLMDKAFFDACPNLKAIVLFSVGYDQVDIDEATRRGIAVGNTPDVLSRATSDVAFLLMQSVARLSSFNFNRVRAGEWLPDFNPTAYLGQELYGKTLGILGLGRIGIEMAQKCRAAFGMDVIYHNRQRHADAEAALSASYVGFDELLAESDVLSIHASFSPASAKLFDAAAFRRMKPNAILVNTARGGFIDEAALYDALTARQIWGAGLDVANPEPMQADNPLLSLPNVAVLPHIGSATIEARSGMARMVANNILAAVRGEELPTVVNAAVYRG